MQKQGLPKQMVMTTKCFQSQDFWAKTVLVNGKAIPGISVRDHCLNVAPLKENESLRDGIAKELASFLKNKVDKVPKRFTTLVFSSEAEKARLWQRVAEVVAGLTDEEKKAISVQKKNEEASDESEANNEGRKAPKKGPVASAKKKLEDAFKESFGQHHAADIAIFGRMVADFPDLTVESAAMFSHALSTHEAAADWDFFAAVDEQKPAGEAIGAAITDTLQFTSAVYYRYVGLNLDLLSDSKHLGGFTQEQRKEIVKSFVQSVLMAVPGTHEDAGRRNSMNAHTLPHFVLGLYKDAGQPVQLINAFEAPIPRRQDGYLTRSVNALKSHYTDLKAAWNLDKQIKVELEFPKKDKDGKPLIDLSQFCDQLAKKGVGEATA